MKRWSDAYRPQKLSEMILPDRIKRQLAAFTGTNLLFSGPCGTGKTSAAHIMVDHVGCKNPHWVNGSKDGGIDTLRTTITEYVTGKSMLDDVKIVVLDEADHITQATQMALRRFMEEHANHCYFILTANYPRRIIDPLHSRCAEVDFTFLPEEIPALRLAQAKRLTQILSKEGIKFQKSKATVDRIKEITTFYFPDFRRCLNFVQSNVRDGAIDFSTIRLTNSVDKYFRLLASDDFDAVRRWISTQVNRTSANGFYSDCYQVVDKYVEKQFIPAAVVLIAQFAFQNTTVADVEPNAAAMSAELMSVCTFKQGG